MNKYKKFTKNQAILFLYCWFFIAVNAFAKPIDQKTAKQVGVNFMSQNFYSASTTDLQLVYKSVSADQATVYYYVYGNDKSFVIISGDDRSIPILGYSEEGGFNTKRISKDLNYVLSGYTSTISSIISNNFPATEEITNKWTGLVSGSQAMNKSGASTIPAMLKTTWDQSPYYNELCPYDVDSGQFTVTGCVATAMAQVLKYWNYPKTGLGSYSYSDYQYGTQSASFETTNYDWASMPPSVKASNDAVATLMYQCGVAVQMHYGVAGTGGSAAYVTDDNGKNPFSAEDALKNFFGYSTSLKGVNRKNYTDADWINLLYNELVNKRPIIYSGFEKTGEGHCFIFDGYNSVHTTFHVNWGWGGYNNGFYAVSALNPAGVGIGGGSGDFNIGQSAIIGVEPADRSSGIQSLNNEISNISVYPNPAKDFISLNFPDATAKPLQISLISSEGKVVYTETPTVAKTNMVLNTANIPSGIYIISVTTDKGLWNSKIVIEK